MKCCLDKNCLSVIQGDTLDVTVTIENPEALVLTKVIFQCPSLDIQRELTPLNIDDLGGFTIAAEDTEKFRVGDGFFNIVAISDSAEVYTVIFKATLHVEYNKDKGIGPLPPYIIKGLGWTED